MHIYLLLYVLYSVKQQYGGRANLFLTVGYYRTIGHTDVELCMVI